MLTVLWADRQSMADVRKRINQQHEYVTWWTGIVSRREWAKQPAWRRTISGHINTEQIRYFTAR